jgi:hypothetical protein
MSRKLIYSAAFVGMASGSYTSSEPFFTKGGNENWTEKYSPFLRDGGRGFFLFRLSSPVTRGKFGVVIQIDARLNRVYNSG